MSGQTQRKVIARLGDVSKKRGKFEKMKGLSQLETPANIERDKVLEKVNSYIDKLNKRHTNNIQFITFYLEATKHYYIIVAVLQKGARILSFEDIGRIKKGGNKK